ncbi:MAG TPA: hypothetical protein PKK99_04770 [Bacteroidia bacterium]|nr:hypothetical protein [Bacteroidia bacterium]HNP98341.1 hypothetical protein [Bacteroidia bacterium]
MKLFNALSLIAVFFLSSCTKKCDTSTPTFMDAEESRFIVGNGQSYTFKSNANDTDLVTISDPEYAVINGPEDCDHPDNQYVTQKWTSSAFGNFSAYYEHYTGQEETRYLTLTHSSGAKFKFDIITHAYMTLVINSNTYYNVLVDSIHGGSSGISKVYYGKQLGLMKVEKTNGQSWEIQE